MSADPTIAAIECLSCGALIEHPSPEQAAQFRADHPADQPCRRERSTRPHSIRCEDAVWTKARERASSEGVTLNHVLCELLEGYADGALSLPTVTVTKTWDTGTYVVWNRLSGYSDESMRFASLAAAEAYIEAQGSSALLWRYEA